MRKLILALIIVPSIVTAQSKIDKPITDSGRYYQKEMNRLLIQAFDSTKKTSEYIALENSYKNYVGHSNNYTGPILFFDIAHSDYSKFNTSIAQSGFPSLNNMSYRIGFGVSNKYNRTMFDFIFIAAGFNNRSVKDDKKIKTSLMNVFQFDLGYDVLKSNVISLYPYVGISGRISSLSYSKANQTDPNYTNISDIIVSGTTINTSSLRVGYDAGIGIDFTVSNNKDHTAGTILFLKAGTNRALWEDAYKIENIKYKPGTRQADWIISVGIKFIKRH